MLLLEGVLAQDAAGQSLLADTLLMGSILSLVVIQFVLFYLTDNAS